MGNEFIGYCGIYCENCAFKAKVIPIASELYDEMKKACFDDVVNYMPDGPEFWRFLKVTADSGGVSCKNGCGTPGCKVRECAEGRGVEICVSCTEYPCGIFEEMFKGFPILRDDNEFMRANGIEKWKEMQIERRSKGLTYTDIK